MMITRVKNIGLILVMALVLTFSPALVDAQLNNSLPDPVSGGGNTGSGQVGGSGTTAPVNSDPGGGSVLQGGPGGPGDNDPPISDAPIDGGLTILLAIGLANGYAVTRKKKSKELSNLNF